MRAFAYLVLLILIPTPAHAEGGFFGGAAEGMRQRQELGLQERALETDRRYGTNTFYDVRRDQEARQLRRQIEENNRLLRESQEQLERMQRRY